MFAVLTRLGSAATDESTTEYPHHDWQFGFGFLCRRPDVESKTILALPRIAEDHVIVMCLLHTAGTEADSLTHAVPLGRRLRRFPAQRTYRRRSKWDAEEVTRLAVCAHLALDLAGVGFGNQGIARVCRQSKH